MIKKTLSFLSACMFSFSILASEKPQTQTCEVGKKCKSEFRQYKSAKPHVVKHYTDQHHFQTVEFVRSQILEFENTMTKVSSAKDEAELLQLENEGLIKRMSVWDALMALDKMVDESDPDISLPNSFHAFQTAEAIRQVFPEEQYDWFVLMGLLHDIGKVDTLLRNAPHWVVTGDTYPVGCRFSKEIVYYDTLKSNPDYGHPDYSDSYGIYEPQTGLDNLIMVWGHDEYGSRVLRAQSDLPHEAISVIRFHSFYPLHRSKAYFHLVNWENDKETLNWLEEFNPFDLYSKNDVKFGIEKLEPYYRALINKYFPPKPGQTEKLLAWPVLSPVLGKSAS